MPLAPFHCFAFNALPSSLLCAFFFDIFFLCRFLAIQSLDDDSLHISAADDKAASNVFEKEIHIWTRKEDKRIERKFFHKYSWHNICGTRKGPTPTTTHSGSEEKEGMNRRRSHRNGMRCISSFISHFFPFLSFCKYADNVLFGYFVVVK